jgi:hypothetical protein
MRSYREKQKQISEGKSNCKTNSKTNVSLVDKNRKEEKREEGENTLTELQRAKKEMGFYE